MVGPFAASLSGFNGPRKHVLWQEGQFQPKTRAKLVCVGPEQRVVGLHMIGLAADEILQADPRPMLALSHEFTPLGGGVLLRFAPSGCGNRTPRPTFGPRLLRSRRARAIRARAQNQGMVGVSLSCGGF